MKDCIVYSFLFLMFLLASPSTLGQSKSVDTFFSKEYQTVSSELETGNVVFTSSNLPIIVIETENHTPIVDKPKIKAHMGIIFNQDGKRNGISDPFNNYDGQIGIELRGNSTQYLFPKKPFALETRDTSGNNLDVSLLGMPADNDWILLASYLDRTFIRTGLSHFLSTLTLQWSSGNRFCELIVNGEYLGVYVLIEKIKRGKNRLDIKKLTPYDISGYDLTGGYIYEVTGFGGDFGENRRLHYPKFDEITFDQLNYITAFDDSFRNDMMAATYSDFENGYEKYINVTSFIDEILVQEAMRNGDAYGWSSYFHKDRNCKLEAGPVWDFDQSSGNSVIKEGDKTTGWVIDYASNHAPFFWRKLFHEPRFSYMLKIKWMELRKNRFKNENILAYIDSCANYLNEAQERNFIKWPILGVFLWRETPGYQNRNTFQKEVDYLKSYMTARLDWMDNELAKIPEVPLNPTNITDINSIISIYPNPANDYLIVNTNHNDLYIESIKIFDNMGRLVQNDEFTTIDSQSIRILLNPDLKNGIYHFCVFTRDQKNYQGKFIIMR